MIRIIAKVVYRRYCSTLLLLMNVLPSIAQIVSPEHTAITLLADDGNTITIQFEAGAVSQEPVITPLGVANVIHADEGTPLLAKGFPDLPKLTTSIIVPDDKNMHITVTDSAYTDYENISVAPSKGTLSRDIDPASVPYTFGAVYNEDVFYPKRIAVLREPYILRDFRGQVVMVNPCQYNAVTKTLRVYLSITVQISADDQPAVNALLRNTNLEQKSNAVFSEIYAGHFLNLKKDTRYNPLEEEGNMLIISYGPFMNAMQPLADWKIQKGIETAMVDIASIGNDQTSIKNFVANYYNTYGLTYLLLVGDADQVAAGSTAAGASDNEYGYILGNDHYQEIFVGRFSGETEQDITNQVNKTLAYEKSPLADDHFSKGICIASNEGAGIGDDGEADYTHEDLIRSQLLDYTYTSVAELFDGTHGNADAPGNPVASDLSTLINNGTGLVNYTGHGSGSSLSTTNFSITNANNLTNTTQWPFMWVVGCSVGNFTNTTCLAEAFARSIHNGQPAGAVASFMSTVLQSWAEPMEAQDEMNLLLTESYAGNIKRTFGGLSINGCFSMNDKYGQSGYNMTDTWIIFGDPSLEIRTAEPTAISATHDPEIILGSTHFPVGCDAEDALVSLTVNGTILATAKVTGGVADLVFDQLTTDDTLTLTITGFNKSPYIAEIPAVQPAAPFVYLSSFAIDDATGNNNGQADYDESIQLNTLFHNAGLSDASTVAATLSSADPYISITEPTAFINLIQSDSNASVSGAFAFKIADDVPDGHTTLFNCAVTEPGQPTWNSPMAILLNAPLPAVNTFTIDDTNGGNGDGYLDPGETATINVGISNDGHSTGYNTLATLSTGNIFVSINNAGYNLGSLAAASDATATFEVTVAPNATFGITALFTCQVTTGAYHDIDSFTAIISPAIDDFETNDFTSYPWQLSGNVNWFTTSTNPYEGNYCAQSGDINGFQTSSLEIILDVQFDDVLSFAHRVSSEADYDLLGFYIDDVLQNQWSGEMPWSVSSYAVDSGTHHFRWTYSKDGFFNSGEDAGFLDAVHLPAFEVNTATISNDISAAHEIAVYPNPFEKFTAITYELSQTADVSITLFNTRGEQVKQPVQNRKETAGKYEVLIDGTGLPAGIYFCNLQINGNPTVKKLLLGK